jgi:hypothetical protein
MAGEGIANANLYDLWKATLEAFEWDDTTTMEVLLPRQQWFVCDEYMPQHEFETGTQIKRQVQYAEGTATWVRPAMERTRSANRFITDFTAPWVGIYGEHSITAAELRRNRSKARLKNLSVSRRIGARLGILKEIEQRLFQLPDSATDDLHPRGFFYYLVPITLAQVAAGTTCEYQGQNPTGFSDCAGIDASSATYSRWRNLNASWAANDGTVTEADVQMMGKVFRRSNWRVPPQVSDIKPGSLAAKMRLLAPETFIDNYSRFVRQQNDNLGPDGGRFYGAGIGNNGEPLFKSMPIAWCKDLDSPTTSDLTARGYYPLVGLNLTHFTPIFEEGMYFVEDAVAKDWRQPDVFTTMTDCSFQNFCSNRQQAGFVISYPYV